jgi:hypothetical protein
MTETIEWQFGGWLGSLPPVAAWAILGSFAVVGGALVVWSYRRTLRALTPGARWALTLLRLALLLALLICLANPERVREITPPPPHRQLAVVVDRSDSMAAADFRGTTRLATATRQWKQHEEEARQAFTDVATFRFAAAFSPAASFDEAVKSAQTGASETRLYAALEQALAGAPAAIVCLTDGLDTTNAETDKLVARAQRDGIPIYFAAGTNRIRGSERLNIREIKAPSRVLRRSEFTASALISVDAENVRDVPIELWSGATRIAAQSLPMRPGRNTLVWPVKITAPEPGSMPLEFRLGTSASLQSASCTTQIVDREKVDVLYYQGALQWGYRYLFTALQGDPSFRMESILNPALGVHLTAGARNGDTLVDLPESAAELRRFQIVILAHVFANQLSPARQKALVEYARGGGGVLFIAPDSQATRAFAGTALEEMLPVAFLDPQAEDATARSVRRFQDQLLSTFGATDTADPIDERAEGGARQNVPPLQPFAPPRGTSPSAAANLFRNADAAGLPRFSLSADVRSVKPGAEILAVKPDAAVPLLVRQQFGNGFTAVLATDLLWRWKMSLPSSSHAVEKFWQQLLLSLANTSSREGLRLSKLTDAPALDTPVLLRATAPSSTRPPTVEAISPEGGRTPLNLEAAAPGEDDGWKTSFTPKQAGVWKVRAKDAFDNEAGLQFTVSTKPRTTEALDLPPDLDTMRRIAAATGGAVLDETPAFRAPDDTPTIKPSRKLRPIWHSSGLLAALLGLYGVELLARRWFRLL